MGWRQGSPPREEPSFGENPSDEELVARARANPAAFDAIFDRYWDALFRYGYYRLGSWEEAEDAAQSVLIAVAARLSGFSFRRGGSFRSWVFTLAHNETVDRLRHRARRRDLPFPEARPIVDARPTPEDEALAAAEHCALLDLLSRLPPEQRAVMELRAADLTTKEIAAVLGKKEENVRKLHERSLDRLRALAASTPGVRDG
jgi:RNA polymerase sigma-70 factor (ECF subfamily)